MEIGPPVPPRREPHYGDEESYGWPRRQCARNLLRILSHWASPPVEFQGTAHGRIWLFEGDNPERAQFLFTSEFGDGRIELEVDATDWVRAEIFVGDVLKFRAWFEDPYEEKMFWPDDGVGEAPGRMSKRGSWLNIERARYPGALPGEKPFVAIEDVTADVIVVP